MQGMCIGTCAGILYNATITSTSLQRLKCLCNQSAWQLCRIANGIIDIAKIDCLQLSTLRRFGRCPTFFLHWNLYNATYKTYATYTHSQIFMLTRALLGLWIFHDLLGGGVFEHPPSISAPAHRRTKQKTAFESSRKSISKSFRSFFGSGQKWGHQGSKFQNFPKRFLDDKIFNFKDRATILIPSCLSRQGASNHV